MSKEPTVLRIEVDTETTSFAPGLSTYSPGITIIYYKLDEERNDLLYEIFGLWKKLGDDDYTERFIGCIFDTLNCNEYSSNTQPLLQEARDWYLKNR